MMKSMMKLAVAVAMVFAAQSVSAAAPATIAGTAHDLSGRGWGTDQICAFCHAPHNNKNVAGDLLWNHAASVAASFTAYSSSTLSATVGQPSATSKACLSCHDGVTAIDSYGARTTGSNLMTGLHAVGTDLSNDHPVSFAYNAALVTLDPGLNSPAVANLPLYGTGKDQLECSTCHNVHSNAAGSFLRLANTGSALCLKCHNK
jgi:predicted CXXCH cytochrome family protein